MFDFSFPLYGCTTQREWNVIPCNKEKTLILGQREREEGVEVCCVSRTLFLLKPEREREREKKGA